MPAATGPPRSIANRVRLPPSGLGTTNEVSCEQGVEHRADAQRVPVARCDERDDRARRDHANEVSEPERKAPAFGERQAQYADRRERADRHRHREARQLSFVGMAIGEPCCRCGDRHEHAGDGARQRCQRSRVAAPTTTSATSRGPPRARTRGQGQRSRDRPRHLSSNRWRTTTRRRERLAAKRVEPATLREHQTRGEARGDRDRRDTDERAERWEQDAVAGRVVTAVPLVVPLRESSSIEQVGAVQLRRPIRTAPPEDDHERREQPGDDRRPQTDPQRPPGSPSAPSRPRHMMTHRCTHNDVRRTLSPPRPASAPSAGDRGGGMPADIRLGSITFNPSPPVAGEPFSCYAQCLNLGDEGTGNFIARFQLDAGRVDRRRGRQHPSRRDACTRRARTRRSPSGDHSVFCLLDAGHSVAEPEERFNQQTQYFKVAARSLPPSDSGGTEQYDDNALAQAVVGEMRDRVDHWMTLVVQAVEEWESETSAANRPMGLRRRRPSRFHECPVGIRVGRGVAGARREPRRSAS